MQPLDPFDSMLVPLKFIGRSYERGLESNIFDLSDSRDEKSDHAPPHVPLTCVTCSPSFPSFPILNEKQGSIAVTFISKSVTGYSLNVCHQYTRDSANPNSGFCASHTEPRGDPTCSRTFSALGVLTYTFSLTYVCFVTILLLYHGP